MTRFFLTIDVEDWFQVENLKDVISYQEWNSCQVRVVDNIERLLDLLDRYDTKATFFVLTWLAERYPDMVRELQTRGHEVASHGYAHELINRYTPQEFMNDIIRAKEILEDITKEKILGYRAPSFSITDWAVRAIKEAGYIYDSSYCPASVSLNKRYGNLDVVNNETGSSDGFRSVFRFPNGLREFPVGVLKVGNKSLPWGGGAYFRLLPYGLFKAGLKRIQNNGFGFYVFYLHPWEIDPAQPRVKGLKLNYRIRHYWGLGWTEEKLKRLLREFRFGPIKNALRF